jgi:hypothetical protein
LLPEPFRIKFLFLFYHNFTPFFCSFFVKLFQDKTNCLRRRIGGAIKSTQMTDVGRSVSLRPAKIKAPALTTSQGKSLAFNAT